MKLEHKGLDQFDVPKIYICKPVFEAVEKSIGKLAPLIGEIAPANKIILHNDSSFTHYEIVRDGCFLILYVTLYPLDYTYRLSFDLDRKSYQVDRSEDAPDGYNNAILFIFFTELFLQYAEIEIKTVKPNRQIWDGPKCLYNNKTKSEISIVDSTWFTTLIRSEGFKVSGHFRLQAFGEGMKKRKLVWINDFKKSGYTRKAKILNQ